MDGETGAGAATGDWVALSSEEAENHPLFGVRGWLIVVAIWLVLSLTVSVWQFFTSYIGQARLIETIINFCCIFTLMTRSPKFPLLLAGTGIFTSIVWLAVLSMISEYGAPGGYMMAMGGVVILFSITLVAYAFCSKRVNVTFRLRAKPEWLTQPPAQAE